MADVKLIGQAKNTISEILSILGISRVVFVDDLYGRVVGVEDVIAAANIIPLRELEKMIPGFSGVLSEDPDIRGRQLRRAWDELKREARDVLRKKVSVAMGPDNAETDVDRHYASILDELIPGKKFHVLSPMEWSQRQDHLLAESRKERTLFLFDQDLSQDGGDREGGIKIIASILNRKGQKKAICGLLTHTIGPQNQATSWKELSETYRIDRDRFIPIPKEWLDHDPLIFAHLLKLVALSPDLKALKVETTKIVRSAAKSAADRIASISICDLDHIVFYVPAREGSWEPDMMFRLHSLYQRLEARYLAHKGGKLEIIASRMRALSHIPTETESLPIADAWTIQKAELYEPADHLNKNHLPLELGDIFRATDANTQKHYILLGQPCDLMVRSDGERHPEMSYITLAEISAGAQQRLYTEELHYFGTGPDDHYSVKLKHLHHVASAILDLCAFSDDGWASISLGSTCPEGVRPAWSRRFSQLKKEYDKRLRTLQCLLPLKAETDDAKRVREEINAALLDDLLDGGLFRANISADDGKLTIAYNCQRIMRLCRPYAYKLLLACTSCLGRPAIDPEFGIRPRPDGN